MRRLTALFALTLSAAAFADGGAPPVAPPVAPPTTAPAASTLPAVAQAMLKKCHYEPAKCEFTVSEPAKFGEKVVVEAITYPSPVKSVDPDKNDIVKGRLFRVEKPEAAAVIVLGGWRFDPRTPILAGTLAAESGLQCLYLELPFQGARTPKGKAPGQVTFSADLEQDEATYVQAAQDIARAIEWLVEERKVDRKRIGVMGTSLGGFVAGSLYGMDDRFACAVMQISGGDVASVIYAETNWLTAGIRSELAAAGLDEAAVRERMTGLDPITWANPKRKDGLLLLAAANDEVVPISSVRSLAKAYDGARVIEMPGATHLTALIPARTDEFFPQVIEHMKSRLIPKATTPATK